MSSTGLWGSHGAVVPPPRRGTLLSPRSQSATSFPVPGSSRDRRWHLVGHLSKASNGVDVIFMDVNRRAPASTVLVDPGDGFAAGYRFDRGSFSGSGRRSSPVRQPRKSARLHPCPFMADFLAWAQQQKRADPE